VDQRQPLVFFEALLKVPDEDGANRVVELAVDEALEAG
jgi:hypothetical protein